MSCNWPESKLALASRYSCTRSRTRDRSVPTSRAASNSTAGIRQFPKLKGVEKVLLELPSSIVFPRSSVDRCPPFPRHAFVRAHARETLHKGRSVQSVHEQLNQGPHGCTCRISDRSRDSRVFLGASPSGNRALPSPPQRPFGCRGLPCFPRPSLSSLTKAAPRCPTGPSQ